MNITHINNLTNMNQNQYGSNLPILQNENKQITSIENTDNHKVSQTNTEISKDNKEKIIEKFKSVNTSLNLVFKVDESSGQNIIQFVDSTNKKVIKQIPTEEMLTIIHQIDIFLNKNKPTFQIGTLLNERT